MNWIKIFLINILVLVAIFGTVEIGLRVVWTIRKCVSSIGCDYSRITSIRIIDSQTDFVEENLGLSSYDMSLGYLPTAGWDGNIISPGWKTDSKVTIQADGFRSNDNNLSNTKYSVLAVGDSFTFGDQVSNLETWPSCVEKLLELPVQIGRVILVSNSPTNGGITPEFNRITRLNSKFSKQTQYDTDRYFQ